jgi:hypothetical protein
MKKRYGGGEEEIERRNARGKEKEGEEEEGRRGEGGKRK